MDALALRPYQEEVIDFASRAGGRFINADEPGSGKTPTTCALLEGWQLSGSVLVVAPDGVCDHWINTAAQWTKYPVRDGRGTPAQREFSRSLAKSEGGIHVLNHELLRRDIDDLLGLPWQVLVVDEAHRLKGRTTGVALAAGKIAWRAQGVALLTGTPLLNDAFEVWPLLHIVRPQQYRSFWKWAELHFIVELTTFGGKLPRPTRNIVDLKPGHDELIRAELDDVMIARPNLLPHVPVHEHIVPVELNEAERAAYKSIAKRGWAHIGGELVEASTPLTKMTRLRQLASEWTVFSEEAGLGTKVEAAVELVNEQPDRVVILTAYKATARALASVLPKRNTSMFTGDESKKQRHEALAAFGDGRTNCIIGTIAAMGEGVDGLQVASKMIRLERDWTPARNIQAIGRIRRDGQLAPHVDVWDIVAGDTVDEEVAEMLARKADIVDRVVPARAA